MRCVFQQYPVDLHSPYGGHGTMAGEMRSMKKSIMRLGAGYRELMAAGNVLHELEALLENGRNRCQHRANYCNG